MTTRIIIRIIYLTLIIFGAAYYYVRSIDSKSADQLAKISTLSSKSTSTPEARTIDNSGRSEVILDVPFALEAPEGKWVQPWANACEEATILIVDMYYKGVSSISVSEAKTYLQTLFDREDEIFGTSRNADASQIYTVISKYADFKGRVVDNPTVEDLKAEIRAGRPIISLHYGFDLKNPNIEFSPTLSSYHTIVLVGFNDDKRIFYSHDPGDAVDGAYHEYSYETVMNSMHDYDGERNKADGMPRVIFTSLK